MASLAHYDGSSGFMVDSNIWIDCMDASSAWHNWAIDQLQLCSGGTAVLQSATTQVLVTPAP